MGSFYAYDAAAQKIGLRTQADWQRFITVIRRNTPPYWRKHSEFESTANECLFEAIRCFDEIKGVPFECFLAFVAKHRVKEVLRRYARGEQCASTDEDWMADYLAERGDRADDVAPHQRDEIAHADSMDMVTRLARPLTPACTETVLLVAEGFLPADVAWYRGTSRCAVSKAIGHIQPHASVGELRSA